MNAVTTYVSVSGFEFLVRSQSNCQCRLQSSKSLTRAEKFIFKMSHIRLLMGYLIFLLTVGRGTRFLTTWPFHRAARPHDMAVTISRKWVSRVRYTDFYNTVLVVIHRYFCCILWFQQNKRNILWEEISQGWEYQEMGMVWVHLGSWLWFYPKPTFVSFGCDTLY